MAIIHQNNRTANDEKETCINITIDKVKTKDGRSFIAYKYDNNGRKVDLRFRREVNTRDLESLALDGRSVRATITVRGLSDASEKFTYPRFYAGEIVGDIIVYD